VQRTNHCQLGQTYVDTHAHGHIPVNTVPTEQLGLPVYQSLSGAALEDARHM